MDINFHSHVNLVHHALNTLKRNKGQIVCTSSTAAICPSTGRSAYSASKAAVNGFYGCIRQELAPHGVNITIYAPAQIVGTNFRQNNLLHLDGDVAESKSTPVSVSLERARDEIINAADKRLNIVFSPFVPFFVSTISTAFPKVVDGISLVFNKDKRTEEQK